MANLDLPFLFYQKVNVEKDDLEGHTNLAFEATEIETAISKAKDLKTLSKNLDVGDEIDDANDVNDSNDAKKPRVKKTSKKKRFQTETETRIKNDLKVDVHHHHDHRHHDQGSSFRKGFEPTTTIMYLVLFVIIYPGVDPHKTFYPNFRLRSVLSAN